MKRDKKGMSTIVGVVVVIVVIAIVAGVGAWYFMGGEEDTNGGPTNGDGDGNGGPEAPDTIKVGGVLPMTGDSATWGRYGRHALEWWTGKVNDNGGIYVEEYDKKIPVQLIIYDCESKPDLAVSRLEKLVYDDGVVAAFGTGTPVIGQPLAQAAERMEIPLINAGVTLEPLQAAVPEEEVEWSWAAFFSIADPDVGSPANNYKTMEYYDIGDKTNKKIAAICDTVPAGNTFRDLHNKLAPEYGYEVVYAPELVPGTEDYSTNVETAKDTGAEIMVGNMIPVDGMRFWKQAYSHGFKPKFVEYDKAADPSTWPQNLGEVGDGVCQNCYWNPRYPWPGAQDLADYYEEQTSKMWGMQLGVSAGDAQIIYNAIEEAGTLDTAAINEAIGETDMMTVLGPIDFNESGAYKNQYIVPAGTYQWQEGQRRVVWYPPKSSTGPDYPTQEEMIERELIFPASEAQE